MGPGTAVSWEDAWDMNLQEIEQNVANLDLEQGFGLIYDLLRAYGIPKASISRLKSGTYDRSKSEDEHLWKLRLYYRFAHGGEDLHALIDDAKHSERIMRERPRFLIVRNDLRLVAIDSKVEVTLDIALSELPVNAAFFLPWASIEKTQLESLNYADVKAAEKMARLYDEIVKHNEISTPEDVHSLNVFFSRLLFCFFSEDTGVFPSGCFTNAIASLTKASGEDTRAFLDELFEVLDTAPQERKDLPAHFSEFGYVNGKLFARRSSVPRFSSKARRLILECGTLNWSQINPDIFGSMIQTVVHPSQREGLGMHYTSFENIMKVIRALFLDELHKAFAESANSLPKLQRLLVRISDIKVFDPACGSGNFLVIAYKELRRLEHRILQRIGELDASKVGMFKLSGIKLESFYGIEIDDFAHEIAILSLWLAKHQMNVDFKELFGVEISLIPLKDTGNVVCANATRLDWNDVCPSGRTDETYVLGNPPYRGISYQTDENKADIAAAFSGRPYDRNLDYVSAWFVKGSAYVAETGSRLGFVSTNSVCQGTHVPMLWPHIFDYGVEISFAHTSFAWSNQAKGKAGVTVVVIGLSGDGVDRATLYSHDTVRTVSTISPYLTASDSKVIVTERSSSISGLPKMNFGNKPTDGGFLLLSSAERSELIRNHPQAAKYVKRYVGGAEYMKGLEKYCLWIEPSESAEALLIPGIKERIERVRAFRRSSKKKATQQAASSPWRFQEARHRESTTIVVPAVTSSRREYVPVGFLDGSTVVSNKIYVIYDAEPWTFGVIQSRMHMAWMKTIAGRLKTDYSYANGLVYNTFPVPGLADTTKAELAEHAFEVLDAREQFADKTLAELYDPDKMPEALRRAHLRLDDRIDRLYRDREFASDEERLELLLQLYEELISSEERVLTNA